MGNEYRVSFWDSGKVLKLIVVVVAQFCEYTKIIELCTSNVWIVYCANYLSEAVYKNANRENTNKAIPEEEIQMANKYMEDAHSLLLIRRSVN